MAWVFGGKKFGQYTYEHWFDDDFDDILEKSINVRKMTISDYEQVYLLWLSTPNMGLNNIDDSKEGIEKYLARNPETCFVAEKNAVITGAILSGHDGRRGFIYHLVVAQSEQQQGIGKIFVNTAMSALEREGISKIALVVFEKNEKGNVFWEKQGFTVRKDLVYRDKAIADLIRLDKDGSA